MDTFRGSRLCTMCWVLGAPKHSSQTMVATRFLTHLAKKRAENQLRLSQPSERRYTTTSHLWTTNFYPIFVAVAPYGERWRLKSRYLRPILRRHMSIVAAACLSLSATSFCDGTVSQKMKTAFEDLLLTLTQTTGGRERTLLTTAPSDQCSPAQAGQIGPSSRQLPQWWHSHVASLPHPYTDTFRNRRDLRQPKHCDKTGRLLQPVGPPAWRNRARSASLQSLQVLGVGLAHVPPLANEIRPRETLP